jgi:hypothetical protein
MAKRIPKKSKNSFTAQFDGGDWLTDVELAHALGM